MVPLRLADFLESLEQQGDLARVSTEVTTDQQVAEIARHAFQEPAPVGGRAILLGNCSGGDIPVAVNLLATRRRILAALGVKDLGEITARLEDLLEPRRPEGWFERLKTPPHVAAMGSVAPREVRAGMCQQVVRLGGDVNLGELPLLRHGPDEAAPTITAATLVTRDPVHDRPITARHDLVQLERDRLGLYLAEDDELRRLWHVYRARREPMPLAAVLGGDPLLTFVGSTRLPAGADAIRLVGLLRQRPMELVGARTTGLNVPAEAEMIIEGHVKPADEPVEVGPVLGELGLYQPAREGPRMHVTAITHRARPIYPAIVPGPPPNEETVMREAMAAVLLPIARLSLPELVDYALPDWGAARQALVISIDKTYPGQARRAIQAVAALPWLQRARLIVVVDADVAPGDHRAVLRAIAARVDPARDVIISPRPADPADPHFSETTLGTTLALDATTQQPGERAGRAPAKPFQPDQETARRVAAEWPEYGLDQ